MGWGRVDVNDSANRFFSGDFGVKLGEPIEGSDDAFGINGSLESVAGFGKESKFFPGSADRGVDKVGGFEEAAGGGIADFGRFTAHDSGKGDGVVGIGNDHVMRLEFVGCAIEGGELFTSYGLANDDSLAGEGVEIKCVEGLPNFEHHIVGEVNE